MFLTVPFFSEKGVICNKKYRFKKYIKYDQIKQRFDRYKHVITNEKYINRELLKDMIDKNDIVFVKSPTGKTKFLELLFKIEKDINDKPLAESRSNFKKTIISITPRTSLANKHSDELLLDNYNDKDIYLFDAMRLAITANSLIRVDEYNFRDCYIILDEISQLLRYYKTNIMNGIRRESFTILTEIIKHAEKIIVLDADLTTNCIDTILNLRNSQNYTLYINNFKNRTNINAIFYDNQYVVAEMLFNDFKNSKPFISSFDSLRMMDSLISEMKNRTKTMKDAEFYDNLLKIYSSRQGSNSIDTKEWENKCVMFSPTIIYGIDYNSNEPVKSYAFVFKDILTAEDVNQQIQRNQNQSEVHIYCPNRIKYLLYHNIDDFRKETQIRIDKYNETIQQLEEINNRKIILTENNTENKSNNIIIKSFNEMYISTSFREITMKTYNRYYLQCIMRDIGYNIVEDNTNDTKFKFNIINSREIDKEIINKYFNGIDIDDKLLQTIKRKLSVMKNSIEDNISDTVKEIIMNDHKFLDYLHLKKYVKENINDVIVDNYLKDFNETAANSIYLKLRYYHQITSYLGISNKGLEFNYNNDKEKFNEKVTDKNILNIIENVKKCFKITGEKYKGFNKRKGYEILYKMSISMCKHLFGNDIVVSKGHTIRINKKQCRIIKYNFNNKYYNNIQNYL